MLRAFTLLLFALLYHGSYAQNVGINSTGATPHASAMLDIASTDKGLLAPRVSLTSTSSTSPISTTPADGLLVYNLATTGDVTPGFYYYSTATTSWIRLGTGSSGSGWNLTGNGSTTAGTNFLGTTDAIDLVFKTNGTERARILSAGNFGIGTASPAQKLDVAGNVSFTGALMPNGLEGTSGYVLTSAGPGAPPTWSSIATASSTAWSRLGDAGTSAATNFIGTTDAVSFVLKAGGNEKMRLGGASNTGITVTGTSTTKDILYAVGNINNYASIEVQNNNTGNSASADFVVSNDGTSGGVLNAKEYYIDMGINSTSYTTGNGNILNGQSTTYLYSSSPGNFYIGNGYSGKDIIFFTNYGNTNANNTADGYEVMRIYGGTGNGGSAAQTQVVTIGNVSPYLLNKLTVGGGVAATAYVTSSDRRLKTNIQGLKYGLKDVLRLRPVSYNWIDPNQSQDTQLGLIAQEARDVIPEIVLGNEAKEKLSVNYTELIPVLINAIKEQQEQIDDLKQQVEKLKK
jgi:hypothetical protein